MSISNNLIQCHITSYTDNIKSVCLIMSYMKYTSKMTYMKNNMQNLCPIMRYRHKMYIPRYVLFHARGRKISLAVFDH